MKKIGVLLCLVALATSAFALNAASPSASDVKKKVTVAQDMVKKYDSFKMTGYSFLTIIGSYEELYLENAQEAVSLNELLKTTTFTTAAGEKATITSSVVKGAIDYAIEHGSDGAYTARLGYFSEEGVVENFYRHLEEGYCNGKSEFEAFAQNHSRNIISQHIYETIVRPFAKLSDEEALPLAKCYATYKVQNTSLLNYVRGDNNFPTEVGNEMEDFADRVEALAR